MKTRQLAGGGLLVLVIVALVLAQLLRGGDGSSGQDPDPIVVKGYVGGEKTNFLADEEVRRLLSDKYGITVDATRAGSIEMVRDVPLTAEDDFVWPSNQVALALYKERQGTMVASDNIFNSPIVLYSWAEVTDALIAAGVVHTDGQIYTVDLPMLVQLIDEGTLWSDLGLPQLNGRVVVRTTDSTFSNSGNMFAGLLANVLNGGQVVDATAVETVLPQLVSFYTRLGYMEQSSSDIFQQYLTTGMGAKPIIVGYESQMIEFSLQNETYRTQLKDMVRILYPTPTVWSSHPLIARNADGTRLLEALKDPEIQRLAWERHGFRSGLVGVQNDPSVLQVVGVPATISSITDMPGPAVMERIIQALQGQPAAAIWKPDDA